MPEAQGSLTVCPSTALLENVKQRQELIEASVNNCMQCLVKPTYQLLTEVNMHNVIIQCLSRCQLHSYDVCPGARAHTIYSFGVAILMLSHLVPEPVHQAFISPPHTYNMYNRSWFMHAHLWSFNNGMLILHPMTHMELTPITDYYKGVMSSRPPNRIL